MPQAVYHTEENGLEEVITSAEWYERGLALRRAGLYGRAIEQFQKAANDTCYVLKAYAQIGFCYKSEQQYEEAVIAFRHALKSENASMKETVQVLYLLGRSLESLGRDDEALEAYRWLRREDGKFRDVTARIESLGSKRIRPSRLAVEVTRSRPA